jgi:hypothetical protein
LIPSVSVMYERLCKQKVTDLTDLTGLADLTDFDGLDGLDVDGLDGLDRTLRWLDLRLQNRGSDLHFVSFSHWDK